MLAILLSFLRWLKLAKPAPKALGPGDWPDTVGPRHDENPLVPTKSVAKANIGMAGLEEPPILSRPWERGWYTRATRRPAHPGRIGSTIVPRCVVVHTTDMHPSTHDALVKAWQTKPGAGNCAHFLIGRTLDQGITQFAPITRNANHAGGKPAHGWYRLPSGQLLHPNSVAVGIELDNAGRLRWHQDKGKWLTEDGRAIPVEDVHVAKGKGWHGITAYQAEALRQLLRDLDDCLLPLPEGTAVVANGKHSEEGVPWAVIRGVDVVGHCTLDPKRKTDPGPEVMAILEAGL